MLQVSQRDRQQQRGRLAPGNRRLLACAYALALSSRLVFTPWPYAAIVFAAMLAGLPTMKPWRDPKPTPEQPRRAGTQVSDHIFTQEILQGPTRSLQGSTHQPRQARARGRQPGGQRGGDARAPRAGARHARAQQLVRPASSVPARPTPSVHDQRSPRPCLALGALCMHVASLCSCDHTLKRPYMPGGALEMSKA